MKQKLVVVYLLTLCVLGFSLSRLASAHIVARDGNMSVTLHIEPDDDPVVDAPQTFNFIYGNPNGTFDARKCTCLVTVAENEKPIFKATVLPAGNYFGTANYTFKKAGVYKIELSGTPIAPGVFTPFNLTYNVRADIHLAAKGAVPPSKPSSLGNRIAVISFLGIGAATLAVLGYTFYPK